MPISINGTGTITGISAGGLPDDCITTAEIAASAVTTAKITDANITYGKLSTSATEADNVANRTAKAWVYFNASGTITNDFNVTSVTASFGGTAGRFQITFTANVTNPVVLYTATSVTPGTQYCHQFIESVASSNVVVFNVTDIDGRAAPAINCIAIFGDA